MVSTSTDDSFISFLFFFVFYNQQINVSVRLQFDVGNRNSTEWSSFAWKALNFFHANEISKFEYSAHSACGNPLIASVNHSRGTPLGVLRACSTDLLNAYKCRESKAFLSILLRGWSSRSPDYFLQTQVPGTLMKLIQVLIKQSLIISLKF